MTTANLGLTLPTVSGSTDTWGTTLNTDLGTVDTFAGKLMGAAEVTVASAGTCDIGAAACTAVAISGTTTITSFGTATNTIRFVRFTGALTLTHNSTSLILLSGANKTTAAGDTAIYKSDGSGNWREMAYWRAATKTWTPTDQSGAALSLTVNGAGYSVMGHMAHVWASITFPSTADTSQVTIGGLPFTALNTTGVGGAFPVHGLSTDFGRVQPNTTTFKVSDSAGNNRQNGSYGSGTIYFNFWYPIT